MSQSLAKNLIHLVFSTKNRASLITDDIRPELHKYAGGILRDLSCPALIMNSVGDHIHVLFNLHRTKALSDVIMELKRGTSVWMKEQGSEVRGLLLAEWVRCVFDRPIDGGGCDQLHRKPSRTSQKADVPARVSPISRTIRDRMGRTVCLGLNKACDFLHPFGVQEKNDGVYPGRRCACPIGIKLRAPGRGRGQLYDKSICLDR
jgi:REP element-mobilizing transposase RayT